MFKPQSRNSAYQKLVCNDKRGSPLLLGEKSNITIIKTSNYQKNCTLVSLHNNIKTVHNKTPKNICNYINLVCHQILLVCFFLLFLYYIKTSLTCGFTCTFIWKVTGYKNNSLCIMYNLQNVLKTTALCIYRTLMFIQEYLHAFECSICRATWTSLWNTKTSV